MVGDGGGLALVSGSWGLAMGGTQNARLIQCLGKLRQLPIHITQRRRDALKAWMEQGHAEKELRELAVGPPAFQPIAGRRNAPSK